MTRYEIHTELADATILTDGPKLKNKAIAAGVVGRLAKSPAWDAAAYLVFDTKEERYVVVRKVSGA